MSELSSLRFRLAVALSLGVVVFLAARPSLAAKGVLDGKTFVAEIGDKGKPAAEKDDITFDKGSFRSKGCDPFGFGAAPYTTTTKDGVTTFEVETTSAKEGKIKWRGKVTGDVLEATYTWTKPGQAPLEYWAKGQLKR